MKNNIIPRKAARLEVALKIDTSGHQCGDTVVIERNERGEWSDGRNIYFSSMLRNSNVCSLRVLA